MMAQRYLIIAGQKPSWPTVEHLQKWTRLDWSMEVGGALVLANNGPIISLPGQRGAIVGTLFDRFGPPIALDGIESSISEDIIRTNGRKLTERVWGAYCALIQHEGRLIVQRDPSGGLPAYYVEANSVVAFASDPELLIKSGFWRPMVNWAGVTRHLYAAALPSTATALSGVSELLPGFAAVLDAGSISIEARWSPWDYVRPKDTSREEMAENLRRVVENTTSAWCSRHSRVLLGVSGGLDSSIVAACARKSAESLTAITMATDDPEGDERIFARELCQWLDVELLEEFYDLDDVDISVSCGSHLPRPIGQPYALPYDKVMHRTATRLGIDAFFSGNGGDNVFAYSQSAASIVDRFSVEGTRIGPIRTLLDVCAQTGCTISEALAAALRIWKSRSHGYRWRPEVRFLAPEVVEEELRWPLSHPWLSSPVTALPGKTAHVAALLRIQQSLEGYNRADHPPMINPLMAQPVMEACLAVPSWEWVAGGTNRSLARAAFAGTLPDTIIKRRTKGGPAGFASQVFAQQRGVIRERLMDGRLAGRGILDRDALSTGLSNERPDVGEGTMRLLTLLNVEAWLDHWCSTANTWPETGI